MVEHGPTWRIKGRAMARPGPMGATPLVQSEVYPLIEKFQTVEELNVNIYVSQSEKAIPAGFWHRNRAVSVWLQKPAPVKIWRHTHAKQYDTLQNLASNLGCWFLVPVSGACVVGLNVWRRTAPQVINVRWCTVP